MSKKILSALQYIIFLGGGLLLVWWQLHSMTDAEKVDFKYAIAHTNYAMVIPVMLMSLASHFSRSMRWKLLLEPLGYNPKLKNLFAVTMAGYLANSAVPRLGEVLKCTLLSKYEKLKVDNLIGSILIERTFDLITYAFFIVITILIQVNVIGEFLQNKFAEMAGKTGMPIWAKGIIALGLLAVFVFAIKKILQLYPQNKIIVKINNFMIGIANGFTAIKNLKNRKAFLLHTIFIWSMYLLQIYFGFKAMESTAGLGIKAACSVLTMSTVAMILTPGGLGVFPLLVMQTLVVYAVPEPAGKAFGFLIWGVSTGLIIVAGLISLVALPYMNKKSAIEVAIVDDENINANITLK
jgi:glycosyltransferase 2 family protein